MSSRNLYLDTDNDTDGRSLSRQKDTQSRSSSRNNITVARRNGSAANGGMLEGMECSPNVNGQYDQNDDKRHSPIEIHSDPADVEEDESYAYSMDYGEFESDAETPRQEKNDKSKGSKSIKLRVKEPSRRLPSSRWRTMNVFDDDDEKKTPRNSKKTSGGKSRKKSNSSKENGVRPPYMESSTESEDEDDRKLDRNTLPAGELTSEYWQIQKLIKFVKTGNQTATLIALCALNDFDMRSEICQMAVRDVNGLRVLTNMLRTDHDKCKIATMKLLSPLTDKSKYNRRELVRFGAMHSLVEHIALSDNRDVVGWAATIIANMSQCSLARNILKHNDGIRKLVNLLDFEENDKLRMSYPKRMYHGLDKEVLSKNLSVAKSACRALWSCCRSSQRCRVAVLKTGGVPYLAKLVTLESEEILVPVTGLIQECSVEKNFRVAVQHTNIIKYIVSHLTRDNLELKTYGALTVFKCAEEKETRDIVYEHDGILPIIDLLSLKERNALAAATGAVWKCAQSEENAKRFLLLDMMEILLKYIHPQYHDEWTEEVQTHAIGAIGELVRIPEGCFELYRSHGCEALIGMLGHPNKDISANVAKAIYNSSSDTGCKMKFKKMDGIRLLWTLLKSFDDEVIINSAWALCVLIDDDQTDAENIRSFVGGLEVLVNLLKSENLEVLTSVCAVISVVAVDYQNVGIISDYDVVPLLAELTNVKDNRLRRYLAEAIARCGVFGDNAKAFRTSGAVSKIVKYLYIQDMPLQEATVRALYQLSRDPANCAIIHKHGGVKSLLEMVGSDDPDLQEAAAGCLANIRKLAAVVKDRKISKKSRTASQMSN